MLRLNIFTKIFSIKILRNENFRGNTFSFFKLTSFAEKRRLTSNIIRRLRLLCLYGKKKNPLRLKFNIQISVNLRDISTLNKFPLLCTIFESIFKNTAYIFIFYMLPFFKFGNFVTRKGYIIYVYMFPQFFFKFYFIMPCTGTSREAQTSVNGILD